jgi:hypothetical protein
MPHVPRAVLPSLRPRKGQWKTRQQQGQLSEGVRMLQVWQLSGRCQRCPITVGPEATATWATSSRTGTSKRGSETRRRPRPRRAPTLCRQRPPQWPSHEGEASRLACSARARLLVDHQRAEADSPWCWRANKASASSLSREVSGDLHSVCAMSYRSGQPSIGPRRIRASAMAGWKATVWRKRRSMGGPSGREFSRQHTTGWVPSARSMPCSRVLATSGLLTGLHQLEFPR